MDSSHQSVQQRPASPSVSGSVFTKCSAMSRALGASLLTSSKSSRANQCWTSQGCYWGSHGEKWSLEMNLGIPEKAGDALRSTSSAGLKWGFQKEIWGKNGNMQNAARASRCISGTKSNMPGFLVVKMSTLRPQDVVSAKSKSPPRRQALDDAR